MHTVYKYRYTVRKKHIITQCMLYKEKNVHTSNDSQCAIYRQQNIPSFVIMPGYMTHYKL